MAARRDSAFSRPTSTGSSGPPHLLGPWSRPAGRGDLASSITTFRSAALCRRPKIGPQPIISSTIWRMSSREIPQGWGVQPPFFVLAGRLSAGIFRFAGLVPVLVSVAVFVIFFCFLHALPGCDFAQARSDLIGEAFLDAGSRGSTHLVVPFT